MDLAHARDLKPGIRVAIYMGEVISDIYGTPPIVTTATVLSEPTETHVWLGVDYTSNGEQLPQMYRIEEILGYLMPMAYVERHADGSVTGTIPGGGTASVKLTDPGDGDRPTQSPGPQAR